MRWAAGLLTGARLPSRGARQRRPLLPLQTAQLKAQAAWAATSLGRRVLTMALSRTPLAPVPWAPNPPPRPLFNMHPACPCCLLPLPPHTRPLPTPHPPPALPCHRSSSSCPRWSTSTCAIWASPASWAASCRSPPCAPWR
jgi:hypothetical protein